MNDDPTALAAVAASVAEDAGELLLARLGDARTLVETKSTRTDMVTEVDRASEALIASLLARLRPGDGMVGEEGTASAGSTGVRWIADPLDGTTNYLYGFPSFGVSIAAEVDGTIVAGAVRDPLHGETFVGALGAGSTCNGVALRVDGPASIDVALVGTGFGYDPVRRAEQAEVLTRVLPNVRDIRRAGAAALDLCSVALGRLDAFYERGLQWWDWAAGSLIATEAGAVAVTLADGTRIVAPPQLVDALVALVAG